VAKADIAVDALWQLGALAVSEDVRGSEIILRAGFDDCDAAQRALASRFAVVVRDTDGSELDAWRAHAAAARAGRRVVVCPAWIEYEAATDDIVVTIDPERSFGLDHPTTLGALGALETLVGPGATVLDVGCGSGVLAVGAARLGARHVDAIDVDEDARRVTTKNAMRNGVDGVVVVRAGSLAEIDGTYDVVVANLLLPVIESLGPSLLDHVVPDGHLVLGGLLVGQDERAIAAVQHANVVTRIVTGGWVTVVTRRPSAA
jgi:ribosomal protein L11 methyltransferase